MGVEESKHKFHVDLLVYQKSMDLVDEIYKISKTFPDDEKFGLINQMRRASVSIPSNIAEEAGRRSKKEFIQFLFIALGSLNELQTQLQIAQRLKYISDTTILSDLMIYIRRMLLKLIQNLENNITKE
ncbi:MAG: ribosomal protein [Bacteroidetes bacterium]|nr:ribosomal protein [Bacteroidota bacterium]